METCQQFLNLLIFDNWEKPFLCSLDANFSWFICDSSAQQPLELLPSSHQFTCIVFLLASHLLGPSIVRYVSVKDRQFF